MSEETIQPAVQNSLEKNRSDGRPYTLWGTLLLSLVTGIVGIVGGFVTGLGQNTSVPELVNLFSTSGSPAESVPFPLQLQQRITFEREADLSRWARSSDGQVRGGIQQSSASQADEAYEGDLFLTMTRPLEENTEFNQSSIWLYYTEPLQADLITANVRFPAQTVQDFWAELCIPINTGWQCNLIANADTNTAWQTITLDLSAIAFDDRRRANQTFRPYLALQVGSDISQVGEDFTLHVDDVRFYRGEREITP